MTHWADGGDMPRARDGAFERAHRLGTGTYQYKYLLADGNWELDPHNPRTRSWRGARNSVLSVGGCDEPVLHAPARPWLSLEDDGRLGVRAGLRRGAGDGLSVAWDEGHGLQTTVMRAVASEDEHVIFEARLAVSSRSVDYLFALDDGTPVGRAGGAGQAFRVTPSALRSSAPAWWRDAVVYSIFVDRFRRAGGWTVNPDTHRDASVAGGDLRGVVEALPYLRDLGVTALHLTPVVVARSSHRYDSVDPRVVDPALGGEEALVELFAAARDAGMKVLLDVTVSHVHRDFFAFRDVRERGPASPYWEWFGVQRYPFTEGYEPGYEHYQKGAWQEPLLRADHQEVVEYLCGTFERWARAGADGFRVDAAADVPLGLVRRLAAAVRAARPDAVVFAEVLPEHLHRWTSEAVDAATDFPARESLFDLLVREGGAKKATEDFARRRALRGGPGWTTLSFIGTHDHVRLLTLSREARVVRLGHLLVLTGAGVPLIYYGDELGLASDDPKREFEDCWPDRACVPWDESRWDTVTLALVRDAIALRKRSDALRLGDDEYLGAEVLDGPPPDDVFVQRRRHARECLDVIAHAGDGRRTVALPPGAPSEARVLLALGEVKVDPTKGSVELGPWSGVVLAREHPSEVTDTLRAVADASPSAIVEAWREGYVEALALPTKLYVTVTEACNIRCQHCITDAPRRTREGAARQVKPWLVAALAEAFAAAEYVGFVHGGESLVAPIFWDVLRALRTARDGRAYDAHLLTNGMLLDEATARALIEHGVTSVSVSIDGATGATNDVIRAGSKLSVVCENVRAALRVRAESASDLRVGVSTVVGVTNVHELADLGRLVRGLGVDWLKVEETFPATPFARHDFVAPHDARVEEAMADLRAVLDGSDVVLVDHRAAPSGCPCEARNSPELRAFRAADDFANRALFHPCRADWEQACIDPDGAVHPVDYDQPALGSLADAPLLALWNAPAMQLRRAAALGRTRTSLRVQCPIVR